MMLQRRSLVCGALGLSVTVLSASLASAQGDAPPPPAVDAPPPPAADAPPPAPAPAEAPPTGTAAFPTVAEAAPAPDAPPPAAAPPAPAPAKQAGNPKLKRLPNRNRSLDAASPAGAGVAAGAAPLAAPVGGPGEPPGAYPGGSADPARDQAASTGAEADAERRPGPFGVMFDIGVPDGIMLSGMYKPIKWARASAGLGFNGVSPGLRIGGALVPFGTGPFFALDLGHYFGGDANGLVRTFSSDHENIAVLKDVGYDYMNLRLGAEFGGERFVFLVRGGFTFIRSTIHHLDSLIDEADSGDSTTTVSVGEDPVLTGVGPSLDFAFGVYL
jgi:hypothetical protein